MCVHISVFIWNQLINILRNDKEVELNSLHSCLCLCIAGKEEGGIYMIKEEENVRETLKYWQCVVGIWREMREVVKLKLLSMHNLWYSFTHVVLMHPNLFCQWAYLMLYLVPGILLVKVVLLECNALVEEQTASHCTWPQAPFLP